MLKHLITPLGGYSSKPKLIYGYDTLCGWCYGFSSEIEKTISHLNDIIDFEIYNGGLFAGIKGPKMGYINAHIRRNMNKVTKRTGKPFGLGFENLLDSVHYPYNSTRASVAIEVVKEIAPHQALAFASDIQHSFFEHGADIQEDDFYIQLSKKYGLNSEEFLHHLKSPLYQTKTKLAFDKTNAIGFSGFPAVAIQYGNNFKIINEGYTTANNLITLIEKELKLHPTLPTQI